MTDNDLDNKNYYSYSKTKSMLSEYCSEVSEINSDRIKILEFKPKKILPAKDSSKNIALFKHLKLFQHANAFLKFSLNSG